MENEGIFCSSVGGYFLEGDKTTFVFGSSVRLEVEVSGRAKSSIVMVLHFSTTVVGNEVIFLVVPGSVKVPLCWVGVITDSSQDHVVTFLNGAVSDVLHSLNERQSSTVGLASLLLEVHVEGRLVVDVIASPELHAADPSD